MVSKYKKQSNNYTYYNRFNHSWVLCVAKNKKDRIDTLSNTETISNYSNNLCNTEDKRTLVTIEESAGLCVYGACYSGTTIYSDGSYTYLDFDRQINKRTVQIAETNALDTKIKQTNFEAIKSKEFTGLCPTAHDGIESIYTFFGLQEVLASCTYELNPD